MGLLLQQSQASDGRMGCPIAFQPPNICQVDMLTLRRRVSSLSLCILSFAIELLEDSVTKDSFLSLSNLWHIQQSSACLHPPLPGDQ